MAESPVTPTSAEAAEALRQRQRLDEKVRSRSGWSRRYLLIYAAGAVVTALLVGLASPMVAVVGTGLWIVLCSGLGIWSQRQPVSQAGWTRRHHLFIGTWAALWAVVVIPGSAWFRGNPAWWVPGALLMAVPALVVWPREPAG